MSLALQAGSCLPQWVWCTPVPAVVHPFSHPPCTAETRKLAPCGSWWGCWSVPPTDGVLQTTQLSTASLGVKRSWTFSQFYWVQQENNTQSISDADPVMPMSSAARRVVSVAIVNHLYPHQDMEFPPTCVLLLTWALQSCCCFPQCACSPSLVNCPACKYQQ